MFHIFCSNRIEKKTPLEISFKTIYNLGKEEIKDLEMAASVQSTRLDNEHKLQREPKAINVETLLEIRRINEHLAAELGTNKIPTTPELTHYHKQLMGKIGELRLEGEAFKKAQTLVQALPQEALHRPRELDLDKLEILLQDLHGTLDDNEKIVTQALGNFGALIRLATIKVPNLRMNLVDLSRSADGKTKKTMAECQEKITKIEERVQILHKFLEQVRTDGDNGKTFSIDEISNEWAEMRQLLKEIPSDAVPYVRKQADELGTLMDEFDFSKDASTETCKKFESACKRLLEASQKAFPDVTRTLELAIQLNKIMHEALVFCTKRSQELARALASNLK